MDFLKQRAVCLKDLFEAFESTENEEGLNVLKKTETDIAIKRAPIENIYASSQESIVVLCEAECFPRPSYAYFKKGSSQPFQNTNEFKINSAT